MSTPTQIPPPHTIPTTGAAISTSSNLPPATSCSQTIASALMTSVSALLERALKHEVENNILVSQCSVLSGRLEIVKRSISHERDKQRALRARLAAARTARARGARSVGCSPSLSSGPTSLAAESAHDECSLGPTLSSGSPISLRSKRKAVFIYDDSRISKRLKMFV